MLVLPIWWAAYARLRPSFSWHALQAKERDEKLTAVSEHLLGKVSNLVSQNKQLQEQLAAAKSGRSTAPSSPAASDEHDEQHTSLPANPLLPLAPDETTVQLAKEKSAEVSPA